MDGIEQWVNLIRKYRLEPKEALEYMQSQGKDVASVLIHLEDILKSFTINMKGK